MKRRRRRRGGREEGIEDDKEENEEEKQEKEGREEVEELEENKEEENVIRYNNVSFSLNHNFSHQFQWLYFSYILFNSQFNSMSGISRRQMCDPSTSRCGDFLLLGTILNIFGPYQAIFEVGLRSTNLFLGFTQVHSFQT